MVYSYSPLPDTSTGKVAAAPRRDRVLAARALCVFSVAVLGALTWWLQSSQRQVMIDVYRLSCRQVPWYFLPGPGEEVFFDGTDHYISGVSSRHSSSNLSARQTGGSRRISHLQACSYAYANHDYLNLLVENHKQYCRSNGVEYVLRTGRGEGVWLKIVAAQEKLEQELLKPEDQRAEWIFLSDIDTLFINPLASLDSLLPPRNASIDPFLLVTEDFNGLNAGVFLLKVDLRSLKLVMDVLSFDRKDRRLAFYEQTAIQIIMKDQKLAERGEAVFMPSELFNSYIGTEIGEAAFEKALPTVMLHYPSREAKRDTLIPHLQKVLDGSDPIVTKKLLSEGRNAYRASIAKFWQAYAQASVPE